MKRPAKMTVRYKFLTWGKIEQNNSENLNIKDNSKYFNSVEYHKRSDRQQEISATLHGARRSRTHAHKLITESQVLQARHVVSNVIYSSCETFTATLFYGTWYMVIVWHIEWEEIHPTRTIYCSVDPGRRREMFTASRQGCSVKDHYIVCVGFR